MRIDEPVLIDIIAGARPNFMKVVPIIRALQACEAAGGHTAQAIISSRHVDCACWLRVVGHALEALR